MLRSAAVCLILAFSAAFAFAQIPGGNVYFGYAHTDTNVAPGQAPGLNGWNASGELKVLPLLGVVADVSGFYGSQSLLSVCPVQFLPPCTTPATSTNLSEYNYLFGPRLSFTLGKFRPFAHALIGVSHLHESAGGVGGGDTSFGDALGGGLDYHLIPLISWRLQLDALQTRFSGSSQNNLRFTTGIAVHF